MTTTAPTSAATAGTAATGSALTQTAVDFNMFLKLLTTQMQNQDPLKPMDSTEYTQQLAQFSQVEQTVKQTSTLTDILAQLNTQNIAQASGFIGRTAEFDSPTSGLSAATPAQWNYAAPVGTATLTAKITDASGATVATPSLDPAQKSFSWDGTRTDGRIAAPGVYTLSIVGADSKGAATAAVGISSVGKVAEVESGNGAVTLGVNGAKLSLSALKRLADGG